MTNEMILNILSGIGITVVGGLAAANVLALAGYLLRKDRLVERAMRHAVRITSLFRLGIR